MAEGPIGDKSGFLLSARQSYIGFVLGLALKGNSSFDFAVAPSSSDVTGIFDTTLSSRDTFRLVTVGSLDTLKFLFDSPVSKDNSGRGTFYYKTAFYRLIPEYTHKYDDGSATRLSLESARIGSTFS